MRVVIDTNVVLDLWVFADPAALPIEASLARGDWTALRSEACDDEYADVLARAQFALAAARRDALLAQWQARAQRIAPIERSPLRCVDPDDQKFLDLAASGRADLLLTKDRSLLRLARPARALGLRILAPASVQAAFSPA